MMEALPGSETARTIATEGLHPIALAKTIHPPIAHHTIARPRLLPCDTVAQTMQMGVFVAPAGYGTSTAALQVAQHVDANHCWLNIERSDNHPIRMAWLLVAALPFDARATRAIYQVIDRGAQMAADVLRAEVERLPNSTLLVLDGLHNVDHRGVISMLAEWINVPPPNLRLLCTSRGEPPLPLDRARAQGRLFELRAEELAFTRHEAHELLNNLDGIESPDPATIDELWERTAGWSAALYLSALDLPAERDTVPTSVARFLDVEVLDDLPSRALSFLRETSVLDDVHPDLCNVLTGDEDGQAMLQWLSDNHIFTNRDAKRGATFRYHPLVRQHLRNELAAIEPERHDELCDQAAHWYQDRGDLVSAIAYATRARNVRLGNRLVANSWRNVADRVIFRSVRDWATSIGPDATTDAVVCTILAWGALTQGDEQGMRRWIERARTYTTDATDATVRVSTDLILAHWYSHCGELDQMRTHVDTAISTVSSVDRSDRPFYLLPALRVAVTCMDGIASLLDGDVGRARELLQAASVPVREPDQEQALLDVLNYLALAEALHGDLDQAIVHADEAVLRVSRRRGVSPSCSMAYLTQSIAHLSEGDWEHANSALMHAQSALDSQVGPVQRGLIHLQFARLHHFRGRLDDAHQSLRDAREMERTAPDSLLRSQIQAAANELRFLGRGTNDQLPPGARELTSREVEVMRALRRPESRRDLARELHISENTLKTHMTAISRKLDASGREAIVERAVELGILG